MATKKQTELAGYLERLNASLAPAGFEMKIGHRNGYVAVDLYKIGGGCFTNVTTAKSENDAAHFVWLMAKGAEIAAGHP